MFIQQELCSQSHLLRPSFLSSHLSLRVQEKLCSTLTTVTGDFYYCSVPLAFNPTFCKTVGCEHSWATCFPVGVFLLYLHVVENLIGSFGLFYKGSDRIHEDSPVIHDSVTSYKTNLLTVSGYFTLAMTFQVQ